MSVKFITWAFETECPSTSAKFVLVKLADHANDDGECFPSMDYICRHTQLTRPTVIKAIKALEDAGLLKVERQKIGKVNLVNRYRLGGVVKEFNQGSKATLPGGSKAALQEPSPSEPSMNRQGVESSVPDDPSALKNDVEKAVYNWNVTAEPLGLPLVKILNEKRRRSLRARLLEVGLPGWTTALENLERSDFCQGKNDRGWRANFDFMLQPDSLAKLIEGVYAN